jgi:hypothetical protein
MWLHPQGSLALQYCQFLSNQQNDVLALFTSSYSDDITCLFFVRNTCGNNGDYRGLIYVEGAHTFTHGVLLNNNIDSGIAFGFESSKDTNRNGSEDGNRNGGKETNCNGSEDTNRNSSEDGTAMAAKAHIAMAATTETPTASKPHPAPLAKTHIAMAAKTETTTAAQTM